MRHRQTTPLVLRCPRITSKATDGLLCRVIQMYTIDFETKAIQDGSKSSPKPVGVAIKHNDEESKYVSWGHPSENNSTFSDARHQLQEIWNSDEEVLCHHIKFDLRICMEWFSLPWPEKPHDTMYQAFLHNPRDASLGLKQLAKKYLNMAPEEQDELKEWIIENVTGARPTNWGAYISDAPGDLAGKYAVGDVDRTYGLYNYFKPCIEEEKFNET